ncbi:putative ribonuclease H-like domain-containing protein [Tanacetum coccineum]
MTKTTNEQRFLSAVYEGKTHEDLHTCMFFCFLSQEEPKRVTKALSDSAWVEAMQEELLQFKLQKVWVLVDLPKGKRAIGTKWIFRNKKDKRGIVIRNKARLVAQGYTQEEGIDYEEVFAPIEEEVYVCQPLRFEDPNYPDKVYKVVKALYELYQAPRAWYETLAKYLLDNGFHRGKIDQTPFIKNQKGDILLIQVYVDDIIFGSTKKELCLEFEKLMHDKFQMSSMGELTFFLDVRTASTPMDTEKPLLKDSDGDDVDVHIYRSMIGSSMYLISSRPDIMFAVCLWYPRDSPFDLVAYSDSNYAGASLDRKSTIGGCQFLGCRLISWQCKKQTMVATSSTEAEYVAAASCCGQVLWIQNQMLDYGYNFMHTMINIDNNSTICIVKNPVSHTKTKHIEIRYHFIRDCNDKKLIQVVKIHTDNNFTDLLTKALDSGRFGDEAVHKELGDRMERASTTASSLEAEQDSEIFEQLALIGYLSDSARLTFQKGHFSPQWRDITRKASKIPQSQFPTQTQVADEATFTSVDVDAGGTATTDIGLDAGQGSDKVKVLENDMQQTKKGRKISEIDKDPTISLVQPEQDMEYDFDVSTAKDLLLPVYLLPLLVRLLLPSNTVTEEFDRARQEQEVVAKADQAHDIDWNDPVFLRYHPVQNISFLKLNLVKRDQKKILMKTCKTTKLGMSFEKKSLRDSMDVVPRDDIAIDVESLATKYPIVDWKTHVLTENMMYYQIIRADGSSKNYKIFSEMLDDFDRQDVLIYIDWYKKEVEIRDINMNSLDKLEIF